MSREWTGESILRFCFFMDLRVVLTAAELDLFAPLAQRPLTAEQLAKRIGADERPLSMLLDALTSLDFLTKTNSAYSCPPEIARYMTWNGEETVLPMLRHHVGIWERASRLTEKVRGSHAAKGGMTDDEATQAFIEAMHGRARVTAKENVAVIGVGGAKKLIDVGGASGSYTIAFLQSSPELRATLFDRPQVIEMARRRLTDEALLDRVTLVGGDFYVDPLPTGHDLALISAIIHQNSPEQNVELYRKVFNALEPGGRVAIRDHVMSPDKTSPTSGAMFAINMLVSTPGGGTYSFEEIRSTLEEAGFERVRLVRGNAEMECIVEAFRPQ
jgi:predicted O-methyltransferase YrrM